MEPGARVLSNYLSSRSMYSSIIHQSTSNDLLLGAPIFFRLVLSNLWSLCDPSFLSVPTYILINFDSSGCGVAPKFQNSGALADAMEGNFWTQHMHMTRRNFKYLPRAFGMCFLVPYSFSSTWVLVMLVVMSWNAKLKFQTHLVFSQDWMLGVN